MSKVSWKNIFAGFQWKVFESKLTFVIKGCTTYNTLTQCKARQVLWDLFNSSQVNASEIIFVA